MTRTSDPTMEEAPPPTKKQRLALLIERGTAMADAQHRREDQRLAPYSHAETEQGPPSVASVASETRSTRWSEQEDAKLRGLVDRLGTSDWRRIAADLGSLRDRKRCRERYVNHIAPTLQKAPWTPREDARLVALHRALGPKWARIASQVGGRGPDEVKNRLRALLDEQRAGDAAPEAKETLSWSREETEALRALVRKHGPRNWLLIASQLSGQRTDQQCMQHWHRVADEAIVKGKGSWSSEEDAVLLAKVQELGQSWAKIARFLPGRVGKQCRERFLNHVDPSINKGPWTGAEEDVLEREHEKHPAQWVQIAKALPGRSANATKNHWHVLAKSRSIH